MQNNQDEQTGRRGLFAINPKESPYIKQEIPEEKIKLIVSSIVDYTNGDYPQVPDIFIPLLDKLKNDNENLTFQKQENQKISQELEVLLEEQATIKKEHEIYLTDLISAHTEFDRALEIFQYHSIPMALTGSDYQILDANDIFCSIFSVERSSITRQFPAFSQYIPDELSFLAPDGIKYSTISLNPPIVPFDHEASSLKLLIPSPIEETNIKELKAGEDHQEIFNKALKCVLIPVAIIDVYNTIVFSNDALLTLLAREHQDVFLRDIASCGITPVITENLNQVRTSDSRHDFQTSIIHRDNQVVNVWIQLVPLHDKKNHILALIFPDEEEPELHEKDPDTPIVKSDTNIKTLIDLNPSPIVLFDKDYRIIVANEGLSELIGVAADQLSGQTLSDIGLKIPEISEISEEINVIKNDVCIESPFGMLWYSGLIISSKYQESGNYILILQPSGEETPVRQVAKKKEDKPDTTPVIMGEAAPIPLKEKNFPFETVPIPIIEYDGTAIIGINKNFRAWSGISDDILPEYVLILISQVTQSLSNPEQVFSSIYPTGMKSYRLLSYSNPDNSINRIVLFIDQTNAFEKIATLESEISDISKELINARENLSKEHSSDLFSDEISNQIDIVEFELSGGRYAMDIGMVREVVEMLPITPLPKTPPYIIGIINLRGEVTHVVDLGILLGEGKKKDRTGQKIIIVPPDAAHGEHLGIIVDNVRSVTEIAVKQITALGDEINNRIQTRIKGIIKVKHDDLIDKREGEEKGDNLVIWLDMKEILTSLAGFR